MALDLVEYESKAREAVREFWKNRASAGKKQATSGKSDQGERASVTAGKNMDGLDSGKPTPFGARAQVTCWLT